MKKESDSNKASNDDIKDHILLVEDNELNLEIVKCCLDGLGYRLDVANNGKEGVIAAEKHNYDVILMDSSMPVMDGFEATATIRKSEGENKHATIIAYSGNSLKGDREKYLAAGMDDCLSKPASKKEIVGIITFWIDSKK